MHSRDLLDVIFLLGSFQVKKKKEYMRDKGLVFLIKGHDAQNANCEYEIHHKCTVFNNILSLIQV